ncbi:hypothetical protein [Plasmodium yoelii yoelii]|uniref:Uncharacterized protein n=1 Tax=Plasmodium yoelii yoelii TaxID=73239 RepID=Q7R7Y0_PLAYO|nr:hypothetical protein [Plasmodium yoelii yoelii]
MKKNIEPYLPIIEKKYLSLRLKEDEKTKKRDNPIESNLKQNEIEEEYQRNLPYNEKQENYIEDYNQDYTELDSFIDYNMDKSSGMLLQVKQKNNIIQSTNKDACPHNFFPFYQIFILLHFLYKWKFIYFARKTK